MPQCARDTCGRWRPRLFVRSGVAGIAFEGTWFCSPACLQATLRERLEGAGTIRRARLLPRGRVRIGSVLASHGVLRAADLARALEAQKASGARFGAEVRRLGLASDLDVLRALAAQEGVKYLAAIDGSTVGEGPGGLSADTVRALGVVPFAADPLAHRLYVACAAPVPRLALSAMAYLTEWAVEPFLVSDELLPDLMAAYGTGRTEGRATGAQCGLDAAAARIARAVSSGRADRLTHARSDRHVWCRLEGCAGPEDILLPIGSAPEDTCRVAPTSH